MPEDKVNKNVLNFKSAGMKRAGNRDATVSQGKQFGIGNFISWAIQKYPQLTLGQLEQKMPSLEREYAQEKAMRKNEPDMVPSIAPQDPSVAPQSAKALGKIARDTLIPKAQENEDLNLSERPLIPKIYVDGQVVANDWDSAIELAHQIGIDNRDLKYIEKQQDSEALLNFLHGHGYSIHNESKDLNRLRKLAGMEEVREDSVEKDIIGHIDAESDMLRKELFKMGKYSVELYRMLDKLPNGDFPHWWQAKLVKAGEYLADAKHYLEAELYSPEEESPLDTDETQELQDINPSGV